MEYQNIDDKIARLGIYELRNLAREVGVASPTTKRREELISMIKDIVASGKLVQKKSGAGRPAKKLYGQNELLNSLSSSQVEDSPEDFFRPMNTVSDLVFYENDIDLYGLKDFNIESAGVIRKTAKGYYIINRLSISKKTAALIPTDMVEQYSLVEGDYVFGICKMNSKNNYGVMESISYINGVPSSIPTAFVTNDYILPTKMIEGIDLQIKEGQAVIEGFEDVKTTIEAISNRVDILSKNGFTCIALAINIGIESKIRLDRIKNLFSIVSMYDDAMEEAHGTIIDAINYAKTLYSRGKKVAVFAINMTEYYNILDYHFVNMGARIGVKHTNYTIQLVKKISALAKQGSTGASITVFGTYLHDDIEEYENEIKELSKVCQW